YGTASRTFTQATIALLGAVVSNMNSVAVADYNGDGKQDIAFARITSAGYTADVLYQSPSGTFSTAPQELPLNSTNGPRGLFAGDYSRDHKPDLVINDQDAALDSLINTSGSGSFPTCFAPGKPGVTVCSPAAGATVASPVNFNTAASMFSPVRDIQVWIDG